MHTAKSRDESPSALSWDKCFEVPTPINCSGDADTVFNFDVPEKPGTALGGKTEKMQRSFFIPFFEVAETTYRLVPLCCG